MMQIVPLRTEPAGALRMPGVSPARDVSIIVPALNEAMNLPELFRRIDAAMAGRSYEVIVVDDGSADETVTTCRIIAADLPIRLIVRRNPVGGLSGAVLHGMALARGQILVVMDADLQHPPEALGALLAPLENGDADFSIGSRYIEGGRTQRNWGLWRKLNSLAATWLARPLANGVRDPMSGFFALRADTLRHAARLNPTGYKIALELICKCRVQAVSEIPIDFANRAEGESKLSARQQARFLRHLARLYIFKYPARAAAARLAVGGLMGCAFSFATNPAMMPLIAPWAAIAAWSLTRSLPVPHPSRRSLVSQEVDLREQPAKTMALAA